MQHGIETPKPTNVGICRKLRRSPDTVTHLEGEYITVRQTGSSNQSIIYNFIPDLSLCQRAHIVVTQRIAYSLS